MDTITTHFRVIIKKIIQTYADEQPIDPDVITEVVMDEERGHYEVFAIGWRGNKRVHHTIIHIDLISDKVWLQHDGTDRVIADELVAAGIPPQSLVLGFRHPRVRAFTDFAVA
ncbi:MAG: XisI protein [Caldilinea sp. CFX5]|nr:XisI protein [Caldilinea sp. CFX5]